MEKIKYTVDNVIRKNRTSVVWRGGDINLPDICWKTQSSIGHQNTLRINSTFLDLAQDNILEQVVTFPTRKEHTLDLFLPIDLLYEIDANPYQALRTMILYILIST
jgi:hypothetical protein